MMANIRAKVLKGLMSLTLCPRGKRLLNESIVGGKGPALFEPHMAACTTCRDEMDRYIERMADELIGNR